MDYGKIAYAELEIIKLKLYEITQRLQVLEKGAKEGE